MLGKTEHIHFVGIGGIGMSGLATIMHNLKFKVTGSDINRSRITKRLRKQGIKIYYNHRPENILGADVVVYSSAIKDNNPELAEARRINIPLIHRAELLAELTRLKTSVCISGTHGKTTATSLISEVLQRGGLSPTTMIGGIVKGKSQARLGKGNYFVCEVDESDKSFLKVFPSYAVITNIEAEHLDHYKNLDEILENFSHFANHIPFWGCTLLGTDIPTTITIKDKINKRMILYGLNDDAQLRAYNVHPSNFGSVFQVKFNEKKLGKFRIHLPGMHNVSNALAAIGIGVELGVKTSDIIAALEQFRGVYRRLEFKGEIKGIKIFDDYGHHPTEIAVTLQTLRNYFPEQRLITIFQPHRYTRTYYLFNEFAFAFLYADIVIITEIYPAHESPIPGVSGEALARRIKKEQKSVYYIPTFSEIIKFVKTIATPDDIIITQGAGDINQLPPRLIKELK